MSDLTKKKLRIARQAFRLAEGLANSSISDADRVAAVVHLDFAVETVLKAFLQDRNAPPTQRVQFNQLLKDAATKIQAEGWVSDVPGPGGLELARSVRNAAQHDGRIPTPEEIVESLVYSRDALVAIARGAWGADFLQADIESLRSKTVAERLTKATAAMGADDLHSAMGWIDAAFTYAFEHGSESIVGRSVGRHELVVRDRRGDIAPPGRGGGGAEAATALRRLQILGRLNTFNMSVPEYLYWRKQFFDAPGLNVNGELILGEDPGWTRHTVEAAFAYVLDSTLKMERVTPDLDPAGGFVQRWFGSL